MADKETFFKIVKAEQKDIADLDAYPILTEEVGYPPSPLAGGPGERRWRIPHLLGQNRVRVQVGDVLLLGLHDLEECFLVSHSRSPSPSTSVPASTTRLRLHSMSTVRFTVQNEV